MYYRIKKQPQKGIDVFIGHDSSDTNSKLQITLLLFHNLMGLLSTKYTFYQNMVHGCLLSLLVIHKWGSWSRIVLKISECITFKLAKVNPIFV